MNRFQNKVALITGATAYGRLDVALNNAGIEQMGQRVAETPTETFDQVMAINVRGVFLSMKHEIPALLKSGGGAIVNTSSVAGVIGFPEEIAEVVLWLSSDGASFITGQSVAADGGFTAQ